MCKLTFTVEREKDVLGLITQILDLPERDGACFAGSLLEATNSADILISLTSWLGMLKAKTLHISYDGGMELAAAQVRAMVTEQADKTMAQAALERRRN